MKTLLLLAALSTSSSNFGPECFDSYLIISNLEKSGFKPLLEGTLNSSEEEPIRELTLVNPNTYDYVVLHIFEKKFIACVASFGTKIGPPNVLSFGGKIN